MTTSIKLYSLDGSQIKTYLIASLFILGNIVFPQLCHAFTLGGQTWLPIYFFTLVGAYKYGWRVGLLTAVISPVINSFAFGMPMMASLPAILMKSVILALAAGYTASRCQKATIGILASVVLIYQVFGTLGEWAMYGDFIRATQDFRIGLPGMIVQVAGGWLFINFIIRR